MILPLKRSSASVGQKGPRRALYAMILMPAVLAGIVSYAALAEPDEGPVHDLIESVESYIPDQVSYQVHTILGTILGLCPCTSDLSALQYEKANFHRPAPR